MSNNETYCSNCGATVLIADTDDCATCGCPLCPDCICEECENEKGGDK